MRQLAQKDMRDPNLLDRDVSAQDQSPDHQSAAGFSYNPNGGPRTPTGKTASSKNSFVHGCCSKTIVLPGEDPAELAALYDRWETVYQPDSEAALELLEKMVLEKWYLLRNERRFNQVEQQLGSIEYTSWDQHQHKLYQLTLRYKTAAQRSASKAQRELEDYLKHRRADIKYQDGLTKEVHDSFLKAHHALKKLERNLEEFIVDAAARGQDVTANKAELVKIKEEDQAMVARMRDRLAAEDTASTRAQNLFLRDSSPTKMRNFQILEQL